MTQVAEWAGHSVGVLHQIYAKCISGREDASRSRIADALGSQTWARRRPVAAADQRRHLQRILDAANVGTYSAQRTAARPGHRFAHSPADGFTVRWHVLSDLRWNYGGPARVRA